jgi:hypothetical protein
MIEQLGRNFDSEDNQEYEVQSLKGCSDPVVVLNKIKRRHTHHNGVDSNKENDEALYESVIHNHPTLVPQPIDRISAFSEPRYVTVAATVMEELTGVCPIYTVGHSETGFGTSIDVVLVVGTVSRIVIPVGVIDMYISQFWSIFTVPVVVGTINRSGLISKLSTAKPPNGLFLDDDNVVFDRFTA